MSDFNSAGARWGTFRGDGATVFPRSPGWVPGTGGSPTIPEGWGRANGFFGLLNALLGGLRPGGREDRRDTGLAPLDDADYSGRLFQQYQRGQVGSGPVPPRDARTGFPSQGGIAKFLHAFGGTVPERTVSEPRPTDARWGTYARPYGNLRPVETQIEAANYGLKSPARRTMFMSQVGVTEPFVWGLDGRTRGLTFNVWKSYPNREHSLEIVLPSGVIMITPSVQIDPATTPSLG